MLQFLWWHRSQLWRQFPPSCDMERRILASFYPSFLESGWLSPWSPEAQAKACSRHLSPLEPTPLLCHLFPSCTPRTRRGRALQTKAGSSPCRSPSPR